MPKLVPDDISFTARESGDGTWYVEVVSPGLAYEDVGDFRSRESAEAWIRLFRQRQAARRAEDVEGAS